MVSCSRPQSSFSVFGACYVIQLGVDTAPNALVCKPWSAQCPVAHPREQALALQLCAVLSVLLSRYGQYGSTVA